MKFKLDENLPVEIGAHLRAAGHDVDSVFSERISGATDDVVLRTATDNGRALVTLDKGIANIRRHQPDQHAGVVLLRPHTSGRLDIVAFVRQRLHAFSREHLRGRVMVVSERGIRMR